MTDKEQIAEKARFLSTQARDDYAHYQHSELGYNYRMSNIVAGIGRGQMQVLDERVQARNDNHRYYFEKLDGTWLNSEDEASTPFSTNGPTNGVYFLREPEGYRSNRWLTTILVNPEETGGVTRENIRLALEQENIESRPLWKPMHLQPLYDGFPYYGRRVSDWLFERGLCLPSGSNLTDEERERIVAVVKGVLKKERVPTT